MDAPTVPLPIITDTLTPDLDADWAPRVHPAEAAKHAAHDRTWQEARGAAMAERHEQLRQAKRDVFAELRAAGGLAEDDFDPKTW